MPRHAVNIWEQYLHRYRQQKLILNVLASCMLKQMYALDEPGSHTAEASMLPS
ncbi:hypothetical protein M406DRAFT_55285 [Cryphonectria parasitica EP155]|uniref:Uncharacterized protein n=1 Tax=Cryphonectria parasitica (strain ATCC 38755 / EP155) TaxID=660469 RepID=A0A9P4Y6G0_CRYP1|nr:uncharacterized protein M406DRAFT_55285 [Cryphonectria parasitica EP155]KAF3767581.1 hypothetical protein M406DRAFT_55285 [Cryphonectria parasitica EP155]